MPAADTIISRFMKQGEQRGDAPAYFVKETGSWRATSWRQYVTEVRTAARALRALGVGQLQSGGSVPEDASCVCLLGFNRPEWVIFDLAAMAVGGVPAGIYTTCSPSEVAYIVGHTKATVVLVENEEQWRKLEATRKDLPELRHIVLMKGAPRIDDPMVLTWEEFLAKAAEVSEAELDRYAHALEPQGLATLIYTSGTTGPPKGVMLSHLNLAWTADTACSMNDLCPEDCSLSYLPLSHIAEQMFTIHVAVTTGSQVYFAESIERVPLNLQEVQPTVLFAVPRIWEKFHAGVSGKLAEAKGFKARLVGWAMETGTAVSDLANRGQTPTGWLALKNRFFTKKIFGPLRQKLGLGRARVCVSGAAPISADIIRFFASLGIIIFEVYGQSEDTGPTSFNVPGKTRFGSVGPIIPGVEVKIAADEEILVRGPNVFLGYYREPRATAETLIDGWLHSGDLGKVDADGFLFITGRKKDLIITAGGKNIAPKNIEAAIKDDALVGEAVVIGDRRKYLSALISLDPDAAKTFAEQEGVDLSVLHQHDGLRRRLDAHMEKVNRDLARVEQIKKYAVLKDSFSIERGELTPTLKVKRSVVSKNHADVIEKMYSDA